MRLSFELNSQGYSLDLALTGKTATVSIDGKNHSVEILRAGDGWLDLRSSASSVPESVFTAHISSDGLQRWVTVNGRTFVLTKLSGTPKRGGQAHHAAGVLTTPMPGLVRAVQVAEGDSVTKGQTLVIVEAMKMEIKVAAPFDGVVKTVKVKPGQTVEKDQPLVDVESK
jgi:3-methylcrotonyl-CoA carboxylase alpha subunit